MLSTVINNNYYLPVCIIDKIFETDDFHVFTQDEFERVELFSGTDLHDFIPKAIAMANTLANNIRKRQNATSPSIVSLLSVVLGTSIP